VKRKAIVAVASGIMISSVSFSAFSANEPIKDKTLLAEDGKKLYYSWSKQNPASRMKVYGAPTDSPSLEICVPAPLWKKASRHQKLSISYFAESIIAEIRNSPDPGGWLEIPGGAGSYAYDFQSKKLKQIRPGAWFISTARMKPKKFEVANCEEIELMGDDQWNAELRDARQYSWKKAPDPAQKASTFRK